MERPWWKYFILVTLGRNENSNQQEYVVHGAKKTFIYRACNQHLLYPNMEHMLDAAENDETFLAFSTW